jgi:ribosome biogenesis GTPase
MEAVREGRLPEDRYQSYLKLLQETRYHRMTYAERREKDRKFGRMVNTALKQIRKRKPRG